MKQETSKSLGGAQCETSQHGSLSKNQMFAADQTASTRHGGAQGCVSFVAMGKS